MFGAAIDRLSTAAPDAGSSSRRRPSLRNGAKKAQALPGFFGESPLERRTSADNRFKSEKMRNERSTGYPQPRSEAFDRFALTS
jgi:hypothetical protein